MEPLLRVGSKSGGGSRRNARRPSQMRLDAAIYVVDRPIWAGLPGGIPQFDAYYAYAELLPPDRFDRLKALVA